MKEQILNLSEEDLQLIHKFENIAKKNLKNNYDVAVEIIDEIWSCCLCDDKNVLFKHYKSINKNWQSIPKHQLKQCLEYYVNLKNNTKQIKNDYDEKIKILENKIYSINNEIKYYKKENALLEEKSNLKLPSNLEEIKHLAERNLILTKLENAGVDNWIGYEDAINEVVNDTEN